MAEFKPTPAQRQAYTSCRKKVQKVFEKYQAQGLITFIGSKKTCFGGSIIPCREVLFEAKALTGEKVTNFGVRVSMEHGISSLWGLTAILLKPVDKYTQKMYGSFKSKEKWTPIMKAIVDEIERETTLERFIYRKELGLI